MIHIKKEMEFIPTWQPVKILNNIGLLYLHLIYNLIPAGWVYLLLVFYIISYLLYLFSSPAIWTIIGIVYKM